MPRIYPQLYDRVHHAGLVLEQDEHVAPRRLGPLAALEALRSRIETAGQSRAASGSLTTDLAAARAICEMVDVLLETNREVEEICRSGTAPSLTRCVRR